MDKEAQIDHELRIRMLEELTKRIDSKMNTALMLLISGVLVPLLIKYLEG